MYDCLKSKQRLYNTTLIYYIIIKYKQLDASNNSLDLGDRDHDPYLCETCVWCWHWNQKYTFPNQKKTQQNEQVITSSHTRIHTEKEYRDI